MSVTIIFNPERKYIREYIELIKKYNHLRAEPVIDNCFVALDDNKVIGGISFHKAYYCIAIIKYLVVHEKYRNKGIGTKLLLEAEKCLKSDGINVAILTVNPKYSRPSFFTKRGYRILGMFVNKYGNEIITMFKIL